MPHDLFVDHNAFWNWFDRPFEPYNQQSSQNAFKRPKQSKRYSILYGCRGTKNKIWENDGYITLVGRMAHVCDLKGRYLEDPAPLSDIDYECVLELGQLEIGKTKIQVVEEDD